MLGKRVYPSRPLWVLGTVGCHVPWGNRAGGTFSRADMDAYEDPYKATTQPSRLSGGVSLLGNPVLV